jgi:hypothetical protein
MSERESAISRVPSPNTPPSPSSSPTIIPLGNIAAIDLSGLPEVQRLELLRQHATGVLDIGRKAQELSVDVGALRAALDVAAQTARSASDAGHSVTITHVVESKAGRTEVIMGNTDTAQSGKLNSRQAGVKDWRPYYIFAGIIALVIIVAIFRR